MADLTERDLETLNELEAANRDRKAASRVIDAEFASPLNIGGRANTHHSSTLRKLFNRGYAVRKNFGGGYIRSTWCYRISDAGRGRLAQWKKEKAR